MGEFLVIFWCIWGLLMLVVIGVPWLIGQHKRVKRQNKIRALVKSWVIQIYNYDPSWQPTVYFLNSGGKLLSLSVLDFSRLNMPESEMPRWWILRLGLDKEHCAPKDNIYLIHDGQIDQDHWHFAACTTLNEDYSILKLNLNDRDGKTIIIETPSDQGFKPFFSKVLEHVNKPIRDVNEFWIEAFQKEGVPILLETKESMGRSSRIEALRRGLEIGPSSYRKVGESVLPTVSD